MGAKTGHEASYVGAPGPVPGQVPDDLTQLRTQQAAEEHRKRDETGLNRVVEHQHVGVEPALQGRVELEPVQPLDQFVH